jgi:hypothetical protein
MSHPIATLYPSMRLAEVCRLCKGNPIKNCDRYRFQNCKKNAKDYKDANLETEVAEMDYLHQTWLKVRAFKQITTGIRKLDFAIQSLFGVPHTENWRNYKLATKLQESKFINLRMVGDV